MNHDLNEICFSPSDYNNPKAYNKHLRTIAKTWDTTRELAPTFNCSHCRLWKKEDKVDTNIPLPPTNEDLNYTGTCTGLEMKTHGCQMCDMFMANPAIKIPKEIRRPFNNWGPKDNR